MRFNLFDIKLRLERTLGRDVSWAEVARDTGLHPNTVLNLANNKSPRADLDTLSALLRYFRGRGLEVGIADIITEGPEDRPDHDDSRTGAGA